MHQLPHHPGDRAEEAARAILDDLARRGVSPDQLDPQAGHCWPMTTAPLDILVGWVWKLYALDGRCFSYVVNTQGQLNLNGEPIGTSPKASKL